MASLSFPSHFWPILTFYKTWYVIWEAILNLLAEVTYFADRGFYADWWNSVSWDQFARDCAYKQCVATALPSNI